MLMYAHNKKREGESNERKVYFEQYAFKVNSRKFAREVKGKVSIQILHQLQVLM